MQGSGEGPVEIVVASGGLDAPLRSEHAAAARSDPVPVFLSRYPSEHSRRAMLQSLNVIAGLVRPGATARDLPWAALRYEHVEAIRARLTAAFAITSANRHLSALRGVVRVCRRMGLITGDEADAVLAVEPVRGADAEEAAGRALTADELNRLMAACEADDVPPKRGARDACVLALLYGAGLRRSEACALTLADVATGEDAMWLAVRGKGRKARSTPLPPGLASRVTTWLAARGELPGCTALLTRVAAQGDVPVAEGLSSSGLYHVVVEAGQRAKLAHFSPHDLRRTYITRLLEQGADLLATANLVGHARLDTTRKYDRRGRAGKLAAVPLIDVQKK